jgi:formyltetrahydrofolate-dependent phosphoribosylglycinamide formyltransferase
MNKARIVVLISGNGSNLQAIIDAIEEGKLSAEVCAVISNKKEAFGLVRAIQVGIPAFYFPKYKEVAREEYDAQLLQVVLGYTPDWVVLAGWMRILGMEFLHHYPNRVINLHPALPGTFPGTQAIEQAFDAFQRGVIAETGVMVHFVPDAGVDDGPVLAVSKIKILPEDSLESLTQKIHCVEHQLLVDSLIRLINVEDLNV